MDTLKIRVIMEYEYRHSSNVAKVARNINDVYGMKTTNERTTCRYWFARSVLEISTWKMTLWSSENFGRQ